MKKYLAWALWIMLWLLGSLLIANELILPTPLQALQALWQLLFEAAFWVSVVGSISHIMTGFLLGFISGLILAPLAHRYPLLRELIEPAVSILKTIPVASVVVLLLIWLGSTHISLAVVFIVVFPATYLSLLEGLSRQNNHLLELFDVFHVSRARRFFAGTWPTVVPFLLASLSTSIGMAWKAGVAAELIAMSADSLGERIYQTKLLLDTPRLFAVTIIVFLLSWAFEKLILLLIRASVPASLYLARTAKQAPLTPHDGHIHTKDLSVAFDGCAVLTDLNLSLNPGERFCLSDASGRGKTTLMRSLLGLQKPSMGLVINEATTVMVFQENRLIEQMSAEDNVALVLPHGFEDHIRSVLLEVLPESALGHPVSELSGGQRRRVEIVRAMMAPSSAVLMDEPFAGLDEDTIKRVSAMIVKHLHGRTLVVASHVDGTAELLDAKEVPIDAL